MVRKRNKIIITKMKLKLNLKARIPESEESMEDKEAIEYMRAHKFSPERKDSSYFITIKDIFKRIKINDGKVLDIACGYGALISQMHYEKPDLIFTGIDSSGSMIKLANENFKEIKAKFLKMRADKLDFEKE